MENKVEESACRTGVARLSMLNSIKKRFSGSIKKRLYLLTGMVGVIMFIMVLVFIWFGNTLTMITAIAQFERTHTLSRVEAFRFFDKYCDHKDTAALNLFSEKWAITQSYHLVFGNLLEMRTTKSKKEFADVIDKTFAEADRNTSEILVSRIHLLYWHPLIIGMVDDARRAHKLGLILDDHVKTILGSDSVAINSSEFKAIEKIAESFRVLEDDFAAKSGALGSEIAFTINLLSIGILFLAVSLTGLVAFLTIRSIFIPIGRFIAYSKEVAGGNLDAEMPKISGDELQSLSESMAVLLSLNQRLKREVDEKNQMANALRESSATLNLVLDTVPQSIFWKDLDGRYLGCNKVFATAVGFDDTERVVGKTDFDMPWPREEAEAYRADDRDVLENNRSNLHIIEPLQQADGTRLWIDTSKVPLCDINGHPFALLGVYEDITARKQAEIQLAEQFDELHRWHDAMVGREDRVIEVKREVNELLTRLGEPPRYASALESDDNGTESQSDG